MLQSSLFLIPQSMSEHVKKIVQPLENMLNQNSVIFSWGFIGSDDVRQLWHISIANILTPGSISATNLCSENKPMVQRSYKLQKRDLAQILDVRWGWKQKRCKICFDEVWYSAAADAISPRLRGNKILRRTQPKVHILQCSVECGEVAVKMHGAPRFMHQRVQKSPWKCARPQHVILVAT